MLLKKKTLSALTAETATVETIRGADLLPHGRMLLGDREGGHLTQPGGTHATQTIVKGYTIYESFTEAISSEKTSEKAAKVSPGNNRAKVK